MPEELFKNHILSKTSFLRGCQCKKALYLSKHNFGLKDAVSPAQQAIFDKGIEVGLLARKLFAEGVDASPSENFNYSKAVISTQELLNKNTSIIYEATFQYDELLTASDILVNDNGKWKCYEVKSSTQIKDVFLLDAAFQYFILNRCGITIDDISIIYINNQYTRKNDLELNKLFIIESVKNKVIQLQESIEQKINELKSVLTSGTAPHEDIGLQCSDPYPCDYSSHCWKHIKEPSVFDLVRLNSNKKFQLYKKGIIEFTQLPHDYNLTDGQRMQVDCFLNQKTFIDKSAIKAFLSELSFPLFYLDFESFQSFIPLFNNSKPYQQIAFQYSLHKKSKRDEEPIHYDFLADADGNDPRITFIESLLNDTESTGQIMVYNQAFEITILKQLASDFPKYAEDIHERISRIVDLMIPFSKHMYYNPRQNGRHSLKVVLPAVVSGLSYDNLEIGQGADASAAFLSLYNNRNKSDVEKIRINLKEYCRMDTYAMVKLFEFLEKI